MRSARRELQELQKLRAEQDKQAEEVHRGIAQAQEELRQLRGESHSEAVHVAQQGTQMIASSNPFADFVVADSAAATTTPVVAPVATLGFGDNFDFGQMK